MLNEEKIKSNATKYFETGEKYGFMTEDLMDFLGVNVMSAPATTMTDLYNAFKGGLIDHMLRTAKYAVKLNGILPDNMQETMESLVKVSLLYQIGKTHLYHENPSKWHRENLGKMYEFNDDMVSMKVGERSAYYALKFGVKLTESEYQAIVNFDKVDTDKQAKFHTETLGVLLRQANELAAMEEKEKQEVYA
jgi:hypothetical protein